ncbi:HlyD family secretion protein [Rufibacter sp. XAAS-G3-1]|uniref:HlyD family secretion protein n=1 Tax=Rufibacter sp. XAAS-G3-1 TaxID=2729134 RepID=UPI0015E6FBA0|nr:HlyD family secretion protein [Rufibacter sp. XAAS-G3-1]
MNRKTKKFIYNLAAVALIGSGLAYVASKFIHLGNVAYTDNAQVKQLIVPVNARVSGFVKEIRFQEYQAVQKGDTLVILEDAEFRFRLAQARADYQNALAGKQVVTSSVNTAQNNISVSNAGLAEVKALLTHAQKELQRYQNLLAQESVTRQEYDRVHTHFLSLKAKYQALQRQKQSTVLAKDEQRVRLSQNDAGIALAEAALDLANLNLSYTVITAPTDGYTGRKNLQAGQLIQPGQTIVDVVDQNEKWVIANYKETQTHHIKEGQEVELVVDALPNVRLKGVVKSMATATGASFSVMPQDNSAGNFVKVEQRIPVRIELTQTNRPEHLRQLRAGMNVESTVNY